MYFIHGGRATGKTTWLLMQSAMSGIPIMTTNYCRIRLYKDYAKQLGLKIPEPILWKKRQEYDGLDMNQVYIDDVEYFLNHVLVNTCGAMCVGATIGEPILELEKVNVRLAKKMTGE